VSNRPWSSTAPPGEFRTYISAEESLAEFTVRAIILGALFGLLFGERGLFYGDQRSGANGFSIVRTARSNMPRILRKNMRTFIRLISTTKIGESYGMK